MIDLFADRLYVTTYHSKSVYSIPKFYKKGEDDGDVKKIASDMVHIGDILVIHSKKQIIRNVTSKYQQFSFLHKFFIYNKLYNLNFLCPNTKTQTLNIFYIHVNL